MRKFWLVMVLFAALPLAGKAQGPAFVPQLPGNGGVDMPQAGSASGAFVEQLPPGAKPRPAQAAPAAPVMRERAFLTQEKGSQDRPLIVNEDAGIAPHEGGAIPALPSIGQGATVSVQGAPESLPNVGAGAVVL